MKNLFSKKTFMNMTILWGGLLLCIVIFISCKNFMNANSIKREIEEAIEIANSTPVTYYVVADKDAGTVAPSQLRLKKKESFDITFIPSDGWNFLGWEVLDRSTGEPVTNSLSFEDDKKLEAKGRVNEPRENLEIHAKCIQLPSITGYFPPDYPTGIEQDSTIRIFFNKPVNPQSFGNFDCINITSINVSVKDYYDKPYFSDDNKTLIIPSAKGKQILSSDTLADITISIDLNNIIDEEGIHMSGKQFYTFRINKNKDNKKPDFTKTDLYSTNDTTDSFYRLLTDKTLSQWDDSTISDYKFGDVSKNHCFNSVYYDFDGIDEQTGLAGIRISETNIKTVGGNDTNEQTVYTDYSNLNDIYTFKSINDGILKLEFELLDNAGNTSIPKTYYVIKDSKTHIKVYNKLPEPENNKYAITGDNGVNEVLKKMYVEFNDTFATINGTPYKYNLDDSTIQIFTKPDYNSEYVKCNDYYYVREEPENSYIWFIFNDFSDTSNSYIKVIVTNQGMVKQREFEIPKTPKISSIKRGSGSTSGQNGDCQFNLSYNIDSSSFLFAEGVDSCCFCFWRDSSPVTAPVDSSDCIFTYKEYTNSTMCLTPSIKYNNATYTTVYSGTYTSYDIYEDSKFRIYSLQGALPYFKNSAMCSSSEINRFGTKDLTRVKEPVLIINAEPGPKSSGKYIINTQVTNLDTDANIAYQVIKKEQEDSYNFGWIEKADRTISYSSWNPGDYKIKVRAVRLIDGLFYYNDSNWQEFTINVDNFSPTITDHSVDYSLDSKMLINISDLGDSGYDAGLLYDKNNNHIIKYWIIPYSKEVYEKQSELFTRDYLNSFHPREHILSIPKAEIEADEGYSDHFDISNLTDGQYMLIAENWDKNGNCNFEIAWLFSVSSLLKPLTIEKSDNSYNITAPFEKVNYEEGYSNSVCVFWEYFDSLNNRWEEKWEQHQDLSEQEDTAFTFNPDSDKFIKIFKTYLCIIDGVSSAPVTYPQYIWSGSNSTCLVKELRNMSNGVIAVKCDNACVLETAICSINYDDPHKWDRYATKKKPQMITSSDFYFMDTADIYEGDYYCTIAHFADGTVLMSEVLKK